MRFEVFADMAGDWRYRIVAGNHEIIGPSQGYATASNARRAARSLVLTIVYQLTGMDYSDLWSGKPGERIEIVTL